MAFAVMFAIAAGRTGDGHDSNVELALATLAEALPLPVIWLLAAFGYGCVLGAWLFGCTIAREGRTTAIALRLCLGVAAMIAIDMTLGRLGWLDLPWMGGWAAVLPGLGMLVVGTWRGKAPTHASSDARPALTKNPNHASAMFALWAWPALAMSAAVLMVAVTSAPGWLWSSEFGGYDALSYHLQLPKEWLALGGIQPLAHNVYSHFPSGMESAYYHLAVLKGDALSSACAAQCLHAMLTLAGAYVIGAFTLRWSGRVACALFAAVAYLAAPWVIICGSLAYSEALMNLMFAGALLAIDVFSHVQVRDGAALTLARERGADVPPGASGGGPLRCGLCVGLMVGAAIAAKLPAIGLVAVPVGLIMLLRFGSRIALSAGGCVVACTCVVAPWLIQNGLATGNPVFPFATGVLGSGPWTIEQVETWNHGHAFDGSFTQALAEGWRQGFMLRGLAMDDPDSGVGQWQFLPWLGLAGLLLASGMRVQRWRTLEIAMVITMQLLFWLAMTHIKGRFLLPSGVMWAIAAAPGVQALAMIAGARVALGRVHGLLAGVSVLALFGPLVYHTTYVREGGGAPAARIGLAELLAGRGLSDADRAELGRTRSAVIAVNFLMPEGARVLSIGEAAPLYYEKPLDYCTVWDRGPLSEIMRVHPDDQAAWANDLRARGYSHLLVDSTMLRVWERAGWNDPLITADRVESFAAAYAQALFTYPQSGQVLYELEE